MPIITKTVPPEPLINEDEESAVRLLVFGVALLSIAIRESTWIVTSDRRETHVQPLHIDEARAIADAVVEEAKRLQGKS